MGQTLTEKILDEHLVEGELETGEEIGLNRLEARPIATLCLDAQERWELKQKQLKDSR